MFDLYLAKVYKAIQRALSDSELKLVRKFYDKGYSVNYTVEYLR